MAESGPPRKTPPPGFFRSSGWSPVAGIEIGTCELPVIFLDDSEGASIFDFVESPRSIAPIIRRWDGQSMCQREFGGQQIPSRLLLHDGFN